MTRVKGKLNHLWPLRNNLWLVCSQAPTRTHTHTLRRTYPGGQLCKAVYSKKCHLGFFKKEKKVSEKPNIIERVGGGDWAHFEYETNSFRDYFVFYSACGKEVITARDQTETIKRTHFHSCLTVMSGSYIRGRSCLRAMKLNLKWAKSLVQVSEISLFWAEK